MHGGDIYRNQVKTDFSVNINPLGIPPEVKHALREAVKACDHYPDYTCESLKDACGAYLGDAGQKYKICVGNGASELFPAIVHAHRPRKVLLPAPGFSGYEKACEACERKYVYLHAEDEFAVTDAVCEEVCEEIGKGIDLLFLTNPNNPTGQRIPDEGLRKIVEKAKEKKTVVVIDECFLEFVPEGEKHSFLPHLERYPNVIVVRAFTKICAIPGVRIGYCVCRDESMGEEIEKNLAEWNVSVFAQEAGVAAAKVLSQKEGDTYLRRTLESVEKQRAWLSKNLERLGIKVFPSDANFLLIYARKNLYDELLKKGILIRDCRDYRGLGEGFWRVAVNTPENNRKLIQALGEIYEG